MKSFVNPLILGVAAFGAAAQANGYDDNPAPAPSSTVVTYVTEGVIVTVTVPCTTSTVPEPSPVYTPPAATCPGKYNADCAWLCSEGGGQVCAKAPYDGKCTACPDESCPAAEAYNADCAFLCATAHGGPKFCSATGGENCAACPSPPPPPPPPPPADSCPAKYNAECGWICNDQGGTVCANAPYDGKCKACPDESCPAAEAYNAECAYLCATAHGGPKYCSATGGDACAACPAPPPPTTYAPPPTTFYTVPAPSSSAPPPPPPPPADATCPVKYTPGCAWLCPSAEGAKVCAATPDSENCAACPDETCPAYYDAACAYVCSTPHGGPKYCSSTGGDACSECPGKPTTPTYVQPPVYPTANTTIPPPVYPTPDTTVPTTPVPTVPADAVCPARYTPGCAWLCPNSSGAKVCVAVPDDQKCEACPDESCPATPDASCAYVCATPHGGPKFCSATGGDACAPCAHNETTPTNPIPEPTYSSGASAMQLGASFFGLIAFFFAL